MNDDRRDAVLGILRSAGRPVGLREILQQASRTRDDRQDLKAVVRGLIRDGEVVTISGGRLGLPGHMGLVSGRLHCTAGGFGFVTPEEPRVGEADVFVAAFNIKEALHGDRVVVRIERRGPRGAEGRIIRVLERAVQRLVGRYESDGTFGGHVVPFDRRILHEFFIPSGSEGEAASGDMVTAEIVRPPTTTRNPVARVLRVLGRIDTPGVDLAVILAKYELPDAFPEEVEAEAARVPTTVRPDEWVGRTDFRDWPTVTVDPPTARDHDDAISLTRRGDGSWRLAVHIADVAHYVARGSALDEEAYLRGTSVYFPDHVVPMLPHALSSRICSLVEGEDRLTQSVILDLDPSGRVAGAEFHDGVIRSGARLAYAEAQAIVDGDGETRARFAPFVTLLCDMDALAREMRARRYERGSLDLDLPEPELRMDDAGKILSIVARDRLDSMRAIEEFMLAANEAVATRLHQAGTGALFRIHEPPDPERVLAFCELVASLGYPVPQGLKEVRPEDFQLILRQIEGRPEEKLVSTLLLRTMKLARYHESNLGHFGLATDMYAHFTSPIRRYPDLVVHRALRALRAGGGGAAGQGGVDQLPEMGRHLSDRERRAAEAERELVEWKKVRFMADKLGETFAGFITGVQAFGLFVELDDIYVQGLVHVSSMTDDYYRFDDKSHSLGGESKKTTYRLGDKVEVRVARVDLQRRQVDFALTEMTARPQAGRPPRSPRAQGRTGGRGAPRKERTRRRG